MRSIVTRASRFAAPIAFIAALIAGWAAIVYGIWQLNDGYQDGWAFTLGGVFGLLLLISATPTEGGVGNRSHHF